MKSDTRSMWAVMKALDWDVFSVFGVARFRAPDEGPQRFIPVFDTREQAVAFDHGNDAHVVELVMGAKEG